MPQDCLFCNIIRGRIPATIVHRDEHALAFVDSNPQAPTHILVVPRRHIATLNDLDVQDQHLIGHLVGIAVRLAADRGHAESGYRVVMNCNAAAGQSVFHLHLHLIGGRNFAWPPG